jgi:hypothetical protein
MNRMRNAILVAVALLAVPAGASAQFQGDVFFAQPSVSAPAGGTATLEVLLFSGADVVGATHVDIVFDPAQAEIVAVQPGTTEQLADGVVSVASSGRISIVDLNGASLAQPFGTVSLAKVQVRPRVPVGSTVTLNLQVDSLLRQDTTPFPAAQGFSGEILVVSANSKAASPGNPVHSTPDPNSARRALAFRRPGQAVDLLDFATEGGGTSVVPHRWVVPDPAATRERPTPQK